VAKPPLTPRSPSELRLASPGKTGSIGIGTAGLHAQETVAEPAQLLRVGLVLVASVLPSSDLRAMAHPFDARTGLAAAPGPGKASRVRSESKQESGAADFMEGSQPALAPPRVRRGS
jgi:hypothetical protein